MVLCGLGEWIPAVSLGTGGTANRTTMVQVSSLSGITAVSAGAYFTLALKNDGTVWAWGSNSNGQLGIGTSGTSLQTTPVQVSGLANITKISAGCYHGLALRSDGTVWAWGMNSSGQLGDGTTTQRTVPEEVISGTVQATAICAGGYHSLAIKSGGSLWAWGMNSYGELGDGTTTEHNSPEQITGLSGATQICAGQYHSLAMRNDGSVWAWGNGFNGQLGNGNIGELKVPTQVVGFNAVSIGCGSSISVAVESNGTVWICGQNEYGQVGDGTNNQQDAPVQVPGLTSITAIASSGDHSLALRDDGTIWGFGENGYGDLGIGNTLESVSPVQVSGSNYVAVSVGVSHSLAIQSNGTVWGWGYNNYGAVGDGTTTERNSPVQVAGLSGTCVQVSAGNSLSLALENNGTVWAWGENTSGQVGDGTTTQRNSPVQVSGLSGTIIEVAAGEYHGLALRNDGTVWAWGSNTYGQLGIGTSGTAPQKSPVEVTGTSGTPLSGVVAIAAGAYHSLALRSDGSVWAWGMNSDGQIGDGTTTQRNNPVEITTLSGIVAISAGDYQGFALTGNGNVTGWGLNSSGQVGDGTTTQRNSPVLVNGLGGIVDIAAGVQHSLALKQDGTVESWGDNSFGELGIGNNRSLMVAIPGLNLLAGVPTPSVTITSPTNNATAILNQPQTLTVSATENGGTVANVEFYVDNVALAESGTTPFGLTWTPGTWGNFTFTAIATDTAGNSSLLSGPVTLQVPYDSTGSGLPDWWELEYYGNLNVNPNALATCGNGLTNLQCYQQGVSPTDFYNGIAPTITVLGGENQNGAVNTVLSQAFSIQVTGTNGGPLLNAPVTFNVSAGGGSISSVSGSSGSTSEVFLTNSNGQVTAYYQEGPTWGASNDIGVTAGKSGVGFYPTTSPQVGYWQFNSHTGNTSSDSSFTGNVGTLIGGVTWTSGYVGSNAISLDGSTGYMQVAANPTMAVGTGPLSLTGWARIPQGLAMTSSNQIYPLATMGNGTTDGVSLRLRGGGAAIEAEVDTPSGVVLIDGTQSIPTDGYWHQFSLLYDGTSILSVGLDGNLIGSQSNIQIQAVASPQLCLGRDSAGNYFGGALDVVELRRDFIGAAGVQSRYNLDSTGDGLPDWWAWRYFGTLSVSPNALAPCGNGLTILQCYQQGVSPTDYYNGVTPIEVITNGDGQNGVPNCFLSQGLTVLVTDGNSNPLVDAPVTFNVQSGGGNVAVEASGTNRCASLLVRTGTNGQATVYYQDGYQSGRPSQIQAVAGNNNAVFTSTEFPLVAEWDFEDGGGLTAADSSNTGNPCTLYGGVTWTSGYDGDGAAALDGSSGYLATSPSATLTTTGSSPLTVTSWINIPQNLALDNASEIYPIIDFVDACGNFVSLSIRGGGHGIEAVLNSGTTQTVIDGALTASGITDGNWHYVGFSYNGKGTVFISLDGQQLATQAGVTLPALNAPYIWLGRDLANDYFDGSVDDTQVLQESYTSGEFQSNYMSAVYNVLQTIAGNQYASSTGKWIESGTAAIDLNRRGTLSYNFSVPTSGIWAFQVDAQPIGKVSYTNVTISMQIVIDGVSLGVFNLNSYNGAQQTILGLTQDLAAGNHTLQILDLNYSGVVDLQVNNVEILDPEGSDDLISGQPDWLTRNIVAADTVQQVPATSYVSPICMEGSARFFEQVSTTSGTQAGTFGAQPEINGQWYSNLPLNADGSVTQLVTSFEGGMISSTSSVAWSPFNVAANTASPLLVRKGDSLRLTGYVIGGQPGGAVSIMIGSGTNLVTGSNAIYSGTTTSDVPLVYTFATSGTYSVQAVWGGTTTATAVVEVKSATFGNMLYAYVNNPLTWKTPGVGTDLTVNWDNNLSVTQNAPPPAGGQSFQILPLVSGTLYGVARLTPGGPIVAEGSVLSSNLYDESVTGDTEITGTDSSGVPIVQSSIVINSLPPGGYVVIQLVIAGATFEDGTTEETVPVSDFVNGVYTFNVEWANSHSICNHVYIYDANGNLVGEML